MYIILGFIKVSYQCSSCSAAIPCKGLQSFQVMLCCIVWEPVRGTLATASDSQETPWMGWQYQIHMFSRPLQSHHQTQEIEENRSW